MKRGFLPISLFVGIAVVAVAVVVTWIRKEAEASSAGPRQGGAGRVAAVEVSEVSRGLLEQRRIFSGTLTPSAELRVAPKISGRIARILVDLSDPVERDAVVAILDDAEFTQAVNSASADLAVARAQAAEAKNRLELSERERSRVKTLAERGVASASALDAAENEYLMRQAAFEVARANVQAREAALATAEIRLSHTRVTASWTEGDSTRVVGERQGNEGDTVAANTPLMTVLSLSPIRTVFFVPERDFGLLRVGQAVELRTDAFPNETFPGEIRRIAPVFREDSRQARVEAVSENRDERLKPGMFVRATVVLQSVEDAVQAPRTALTRRGGEQGLFVINEEGGKVNWVVVETGIETTDSVQILSPEISGRVVTLGQQFLADGSAVRIVEGRRAR